ncbi:hypothetical protein U1Q18_012578 [Sarracenia purpurea var. burkii]
MGNALIRALASTPNPCEAVHLYIKMRRLGVAPEAGQWEDVLRLRKEMKESNLKKSPGWSLVDGDK